MSFVADLKRGHKGEAAVRQILEAAGAEVGGADNTSAGDIPGVIDGVPFLAEVKSDVMAAHTGNFCIEYANSKTHKLTGILATKSQLWFHLDGVEVWVANTAALLNYFKTASPKRRVERGGDGNADCHLYLKEVICGAVFTRVDILGPDEVRAVILSSLCP